ncbi:TPA: nitronate monooxygenase [Bacillus pseudomycoides]|nr:nitronate monooxygenase [Bacillus pseudomycoides]
MFYSRVCEKLQITYPIIQAGMAGTVVTPELVAAVSNSGGLGTLGAGYMSSEQIRHAVRAIRQLTDQPFAVNLFITNDIQMDEQEVEEAQHLLQPIREQLQLEIVKKTMQLPESYKEQLKVLIEENVPVFSFTFDTPAREEIDLLKRHGIKMIGTATNVAEGKVLAHLGVDIIVGQGSEAGGHRGTFLGKEQDSMIGTTALIPQLVDAIPHIPIVAAGGIMDGRGVVAAYALGAEGVQMGTAFLTCYESAANKAHKEAIIKSTDQSTTMTRQNSFIEQLKNKEEKFPAYPIQNALTTEIRQAAVNQNNYEYMSLWAGQASSLAQVEEAEHIIMRVVKETKETLTRLQSTICK